MDKVYSQLKASVSAARSAVGRVPSIVSDLVLVAAVLVAAAVLFPRAMLLVAEILTVGLLYLLALYQALLTLLGLRARRHGLPDEYATWIDTALCSAVFFLLATVILLV